MPLVKKDLNTLRMRPKNIHYAKVQVMVNLKDAVPDLKENRRFPFAFFHALPVTMMGFHKVFRSRFPIAGLLARPIGLLVTACPMFLGVIPLPWNRFC